MGLTAPLALLGLALVSLPVAAHLLRRADVRTRSIPTVELLRRAAVESRRRVRVVDPWLLLVRVVIVALGALAVAGPFAEVEVAYGDGRVASVSIVVDDSMSMAVSTGTGTRFDAALARALEIVDALPSGSEVAIVLGGYRPRVVAARSGDLPAARAVLAGLGSRTGTARGSDLGAGLELAARQLAGARHAVRRVVVLSDFAGPATGAELLAPPGMILEAERIGGDAPLSNVGISTATLDPDTTTGLRLEIEARAFGDDAPVRTPLEVRWRDRTLASTELVFDRGVGRAVLELESPASPEELESEPYAWIELQTGDALEADDARAVLLRPATASRIVIVDGRPSAIERGGAADAPHFLREALALVPRSGGGPFVVRVVDPPGLLGLTAGSADVLFLVGLDTSPEPIADAIRAHHDAGAGVVWTAGPEARPGTEVRLSDLLPAHTTAVVDGETVGLERAFGAEILPPGPTGLERTHVTRRTGLEANDPNQVVLRFADGAPMLVVDAFERTAMIGLALDATASDLAYRPGFLPLVSRLARGMSRPGAMPDQALAPGEAPAMPVGVRDGEIELVLPSGAVVTRPIDAGLVSLDDLDAAGPYLARLPRPDGTLVASPRSAFVVAPPPEESDLGLAALPPSAADGAADGAGPAVAERPLGRWLFLGLGLLAALEGFARTRKVGRAPARAAA